MFFVTTGTRDVELDLLCPVYMFQNVAAHFLPDTGFFDYINCKVHSLL